MSGYYNRYKELEDGENIEYSPFIKLTPKSTDTFVTYNTGKSRLDKISSQYYGAPYYSALILMANPELGGLEQMISNNTLIRVPLPLKQTLEEYRTKLRRYRRLYE